MEVVKFGNVVERRLLLEDRAQDDERSESGKTLVCVIKDRG